MSTPDVATLRAAYRRANVLLRAERASGARANPATVVERARRFLIRSRLRAVQAPALTEAEHAAARAAVLDGTIADDAAQDAHPDVGDLPARLAAFVEAFGWRKPPAGDLERWRLAFRLEFPAAILRYAQLRAALMAERVLASPDPADPAMDRIVHATPAAVAAMLDDMVEVTAVRLERLARAQDAAEAALQAARAHLDGVVSRATRAPEGPADDAFGLD